MRVLYFGVKILYRYAFDEQAKIIFKQKVTSVRWYTRYFGYYNAPGFLLKMAGLTLTFIIHFQRTYTNNYLLKN